MIVNHFGSTKRLASWGKAIPPARDLLQARLLTCFVGLALLLKAIFEVVRLSSTGAMPEWFWVACGVSAGFALVVWLLKSATAPAAAMGGLICLHVLLRQTFAVPWTATAMPSLISLFLLTFAATRFGRSRKEAKGLAEGRRGRRTAQVLANLGAAGLLAAGGSAGAFVASAMLAACVAALAEATADTVSSEIGQALGGKTLLITSGKMVAAGTDGGMSIAGTACGVLAAAAVVAVSPLMHTPATAMAAFTAACSGLIFDSVLGATVEQRGWLGNDLVNFFSTVFAAGVAWEILLLL